jgi:uncharacterized circularly permuted ATP-grasp superfamily protein/uncharacterized alpha-E superfamily protein
LTLTGGEDSRQESSGLEPSVEKSAVAESGSQAPAGPGPDTVYDELVTGTGRVRPHWQDLMGRLFPLDPAAMEDRRDEAVQLLRQHGVTYAVYDDPRGAERPWPLDLLPFVIPADEWRVIEAGVTQRARLLNAVLADIHGPQRLIAEGRLPPSLLHANTGFLHPCRGAEPPGAIHLHFSAYDLCRAPDGRWHILADRTQAPSGAGYALENRGVVGRVLADCIGVGAVQPLAPFFTAFRDSLHALPSAKGGDAKVVLLTPGPYNETYFEHVYLARHLGITLVEGSDLTVRDRRVFLKTLNGLEQVGVILRRMDDDFCDPIELRATSALGVAGLLEAVRAGNLTMANALGSGVMEAAAFKPLLADLAPILLGERLILPDVATWWCGTESGLATVLDNLDRMLIKPAFRPSRIMPIFGGGMSRANRELLAARIMAQPLAFVGQERVPLSTAPVWTGEKLEPRAMVLRVFVAAIGDGFVAMPGGLTRTATHDGSVISMQMGSGSKDSWVLTSPAESEILAHGGDRARPSAVSTVNFRRPTGGELPSRVADGLFWVGRYAERADGVVRLLRTLLAGVTDAVQPWRYRDAEPLLNLAAWLELIPVVDHPAAFQPIALVQAALLDSAQSSGVIANFQRLVNAARRVRDWLPPDCWRIFMALERHIQEPVGRAPPVRLLLRLEELITLGAGLFGAMNESMTRDAGWRFVEIGRRLEHAIALVGTMRGLTHPPISNQPSAPIEERRLLAAILALTDPRSGVGFAASEQMERGLDRSSLLRAVLANEADPRSLVFQLAAVGEHLAALPRPAESLPGNPGLIDAAIQLTMSARHAVPEAIINACQIKGARSVLAEQVDPLSPAFARLDMLIPQISDLLTQAYFTHVAVRSA